MFCKDCGKEVKEAWNKCPYCGSELKEEKAKEVLSLESGEKETKSQTKSQKVLKAVGGLVMAGVLLYLLGKASSCINSKLLGEQDPNDLYVLSSETRVVTVDLSSYPNGFAGWKAAGFKGCVTTDISIPYPIKDSSVNNYAVYIGTGKTNVGIIMQEDESAMSEWEWLTEAQPDEDTQEYYFSCTLTYTGHNVGEDELPVFIISNSESYYTSLTENSEDELQPVTEMQGSEGSDTTVESSVDTEDVDYGYIYGGIIDSICAEADDPDLVSYVLYDIDKDGYLEFLIQNNELGYDVYSTNGTETSYLGELSNANSLGLYEYKDGNGIYTDYCNMGYEAVKQVRIQNGALEKTTIFEGENDYDSEYGRKFEELKDLIPTHTLQEGMIW